MPLPLVANQSTICYIGGALHRRGIEVEWNWDPIKPILLTVLQGLSQAETEGRAKVKLLCDVAKGASDHVKRETGNKAWEAHWCARVADMVASLRRNWDASTMGPSLTKLFVLKCETPMPQSVGLCYSDAWLNDQWEVEDKAPENNCYCGVKYNYKLKRKAIVKAFRECQEFLQAVLGEDDYRLLTTRPEVMLEVIDEALRIVVESIYYKNESLGQLPNIMLFFWLLGVWGGYYRPSSICAYQYRTSQGKHGSLKSVPSSWPSSKSSSVSTFTSVVKGPMARAWKGYLKVES
jgi:hypothetical protein